MPRSYRAQVRWVVVEPWPGGCRCADMRGRWGSGRLLARWLHHVFERRMVEHPWCEVLVFWWSRLVPGGVVGVGVAPNAERHGWDPPRRRRARRRAVLGGPAVPAAAALCGGRGARRAERARRCRRTPLLCHGRSPPGDAGACFDGAASCSVDPSLAPRDLWLAARQSTWSTTAAIAAAYSRDDARWRLPDEPGSGESEVVGRNITHGDEHVIKLGEVALESHRRGNAPGRPAALRAQQLLISR